MTITTTWTGSGSTDYYSGANWTAGAPAGDGPNDALIGGVGVTTAYTVVVTADNGSSVGTYSAGNLVLDDSAMTLSIGTHAFTVAYSTTFTAGTVNIAGGFFNFGINTNTFGTDALLTGYGVLTNDISGSGTIEAKGVSQILDVNLNVGAGGMNFEIAGGDTLEFDMVVDASAKVSFETNSGTMLLYDTQDFAGTIYGLVDVPSAGAAQNEIDLGDLTNVTASFDYTTNQITVSGTSVFPGNTVTDKVIQLDPGATYDAGSTVQTVADGSGGTDIFLMVCFAEGTRILTNRGEVAVEALAEGDMVVTADQGTRPINWIGHRHLDLTAHPRPEFAAPVRISRGAFAENQPQRDLVVSPDHCLFVDGKLVPAKLLINGMTIVQDRDAKAVTYYHVELDRHAVLFAEGLPAESYLDTGNRAFFSNAGLALMLHPEFHVNAGLNCWEQDACAPLAVSDSAVHPVWQDLASRAEALGFTQPEILTTDDADLRLVAAGRTFRPISAHANRFVFVLPAGVTGAQLVSRAGSPADVKPWLDDRRQLGVAVSRIVVRGGTDFADVAIDHPTLRQGWHTVETEGRAMWRWTSGNAVLPIEVRNGPVTVEVHVRQTGTYVVAAAQRAERLAA